MLDCISLDLFYGGSRIPNMQKCLLYSLFKPIRLIASDLLYMPSLFTYTKTVDKSQVLSIKIKELSYFYVL